MAETIEKWMHKKLVIASSDTTVMKAANEMVDCGVGSLIVVDNHKPVGIITETDIVRKVVASGVSSKLITLEDIMTKNLISIPKTATLHEASELMEKNKIKRVPVMEKGKIVGIITATDVVSAIAEMEE